MALITPLLLAIMFGGFEAGTYLWTQQKVVKAVRDGARYAGRQPFDQFTCSGTDATVNPALVTSVKNLTRTGQIGSGGTAKIRGWADGDTTVTAACQPPETGKYTAGGLYAAQKDSGAIHVTVTATVRYRPFLGTLGFNAAGAVVRSSANAAVMGS